MTKKTVSENDMDLFRQAIGNVQSVKSDKVQLRQPHQPKPFPVRKSHDLSEQLQDTPDFEIDQVSHEESLSFAADGIATSVLTKLRKGFFGVQGELDLHGLTSDAAERQLSRFLNASARGGRRCVHIIHGKGYRSSDSHPVLKNKINRWLRQHPSVLAFCSAPQRQGGAGAVYVLLRQSQDS